MPIPIPAATRSSLIHQSSRWRATIRLTETVILSETAGPEVIDGPGAALLTISGGGKAGVFRLEIGVIA